MSAAQHRYGECFLAVQARLVGQQPCRVQGVTALASSNGREHIAVTVGRVLIYLQDRDALDALHTAVTKAAGLADGVFGPVDDAFTQADQRERHQIATRGAAGIKRGSGAG